MSQKLLIVLLGIFAFASANAYQILQYSPELKGGLNVKELGACVKATQKKCRSVKLTTENAACIESVLFSEQSCHQSSVIYRLTQGTILRWRKFDKVDVVVTSILPINSRYDRDYFMITKSGQLIGLISMPLIRALPSSANQAQQTDFQIWPIGLELPKAYPLPNGNNQVIFKQLLTKGCLNCNPQGVIEINYFFNPEGDYLNFQVNSNFKLSSS